MILNTFYCESLFTKTVKISYFKACYIAFSNKLPPSFYRNNIVYFWGLWVNLFQDDIWLQGGKTKREIWRKYTGEEVEHGKLLLWMRQLGYDVPKKWISFKVQRTEKMGKSNAPTSSEILQLKEKIKQLEKALVNSELRANAYDTMIDVAEKELKISIRKKPNTKQSIK